MRILVGVVVVMLTIICAPTTTAQVPPTPDQTEQSATVLDDVVVIATPLEEQLRRFTQEAAHPVPGRGLARWQGPVCIGVVNFRPAMAELLADGLAHTGGRLGVPIDDEACDPNIIIVGAVDGDAVAQALVARSPRDFRPNIADASLSRDQLDYFTTADVPVRWWAISRPSYYDIFLGRAAPTGGPGKQPINIHSFALKHARTRDDLQRLIVVVDIDRVSARATDDLIGYLAMVSFAQIDMRADMGEFDTILNLFRSDFTGDGLTPWDRAYVQGLYSIRDDARINLNAQAHAVAGMLAEDGRDR